MSAARALGVVLLAGAALAAFPAAPAQAQAATGSYEVRKGEGLYAISGKFRYEGVTRYQIVIGFYHANREVFAEGNINVLKEGQLLRIPSRDEAAATVPVEASRLWQSLTAKPAALEEAAKRYREGLALERRGDQQGALAAFLEAGEAGNGLAQRKLGQIYDQGNTVVQRDYQAALKWYQKAREQGVEMDKPLRRTTPK